VGIQYLATVNEEVYALISKRIRILALTLGACFCLLGYGMGQLQSGVSVSNSGTISFKRSYICGNYNSTHYYAQNKVTGNYELISTDATQTISYAVSKLTSGRTWQETVLLKGTFSIGTTITLSQGKVLLDCRQATLTSTASILLDVRSSNVTILGGHWIGQTGCATAIQTGGSNAINCMIDGLEVTNFNGGLPGAIVIGSGSSNTTIQNCLMHDNDENYCINILQGANWVINCHLYNANTHTGRTPGIMINQGTGYNHIVNCEFDQLYNHAVYSDGGSTAIGHNVITGCKFHDFLGGNGAACQIKTQNNEIYDNDIWNWTASYAFSIYSELSGYAANDNDIHHNTFTNCLYAVVLGHSTSGHSPTSRNLVHDNVFTGCTYAITLSAGNSPALVDDTKIYYNDFHNCPTPFYSMPTDALNLVQNTVIAYNYFNASVPSNIVTRLQSYANTMSYQNTRFPPNTATLAMANFNYSNITNPASWYYVAPRA